MAGPHQALEPAALVHKQRGEQQPQPTTVRQQLLEGEPPKQSLPERSGRLRVELRAAGLHDAAERHATRADTLAVAAHQAQLEVLLVGGRGLDPALVKSLDQVDTTPPR